MLNQGLFMVDWHVIWKYTLYPKTLCKLRFLLNQIKSNVCKTVTHLAKAVHKNLITSFGNKTLKNCVVSTLDKSDIQMTLK